MFITLGPANAQVTRTCAGAGIYFDTDTQSFALQGDLLIAGSQFWPFAPHFNKASACFEFDLGGLSPTDKHFIALQKTASSAICLNVSNRFELFGNNGNGLTEVADRNQTNTFLMTFTSERNVSFAPLLLDVTSFVSNSIATGKPFASFVILPGDECSFDVFGFAAYQSTNDPQVLLVSSSNPPRLSVSTSSNEVFELSWVSMDTPTSWIVEKTSLLTDSGPWTVVTNETLSPLPFTTCIRVERTPGPVFFRLRQLGTSALP